MRDIYVILITFQTSSLFDNAWICASIHSHTCFYQAIIRLSNVDLVVLVQNLLTIETLRASAISCKSGNVNLNFTLR